jgi:Na+/H+ antiporter NhaA
MTLTLTRFADRFAAAAALQDPSLLTRVTAPPPRPRRGLPPVLRSETGGALLLVGAVLVALLWSNVGSGYEAFWHARAALSLGPWTLAADLRTWVDEGLMTLFFLVVGLEAKRERDLGELRDGRRLAAPVLAALAGMAAAAGTYLAVTAGGPGAGGWGVAVSSDTALALGALTLAAGKDMRVFMLTLLVVDDVVALLVISFVYPGPLHVAALAAAVALLAALLTMRAVAARQFRARGDSTHALTPLSVLAGVGLWLALFESGIDPVVTGLVVGLLTNAYAPRPAGPAPISPNDRLQRRFHPWTSLVVVPVFALANAGVPVDGHRLAAAAASPVSWGIVLAYLVGKPLGVALAGRAPLGTGLAAGAAFTASLLIASRAFDGALLDQAKLAILATALLAPALSVLASRLRRPVLATPCPAR